MLASIWLQLSGEEEACLGALIAMLASAHGTVPFQPHLTVCSPQSNPDAWDAAAEYIRGSRLLPLRVRKERISWSTTAPMRAVVIDVEAAADLQTFREDLRRITGGAQLPRRDGERRVAERELERRAELDREGGVGRPVRQAADVDAADRHTRRRLD